MPHQARAFIVLLTDIMKIVSGGQTGVDLAALDVAMKYNIECGGWCPPGRLDESGRLYARRVDEEIVFR